MSASTDGGTATGSKTPQRIYNLSESCCLCGFCFVVHETDANGETCVKKLFKLKLKLTDERIRVIQGVVNLPAKSNGVCAKCFGKVEKVIRLRKEIDTILSNFEEYKSRINDSTRPVVSKRGLRSPLADLPVSKNFCEDVSSNPKVFAKYKPILPKSQGHSNLIPARKSLSFSGIVHTISPTGETPSELIPDFQPLPSGDYNLKLEEQIFKTISSCTNTFQGQGEVEISIYYPSGKKTSLIVNNAHKKICKAIFKSDNVGKAVLDVLSISNPDDVVIAASKIVQAEAKAMCRRNSGSLLQKKDHDSLMTFTWNEFYKDLEVHAPNLLRVISAVVSDVPVAPTEKKFMNILHTIASGCHGRSQEMSALHYCIAFVLLHGGCTQRDIERLAKIGLCVSPGSVHNKLASWIDKLDEDIIQLKRNWSEGGNVKYQLVGDNWDKNILPAFRTSQQKTLSLHLFNVVVVVDRVIPTNRGVEIGDQPKDIEFDIEKFIPSIEEQAVLMDELVFHFATSVIQGVPHMKAEFAKIYPVHLTHPYSAQAGEKTKQYPLGLFDKNETKTAEMIQLLRDLQSKYVPLQDGHIVESVFFGGDRLTDERIQCAQQSVLNGETPEARLEGFISKIEDFHRLMNFLEAICRLTYSTDSAGDRGTACYFRNLLDARNVKGDVKNAYRPYKILFYTILDAMCTVLFYKKFNRNPDEEITLPVNFEHFSTSEKISWLNVICREILEEYFFESQSDIMNDLREILTDISHPENYYLSNLENDRFQCHFCPKSYAFVGTLKAHENKVHGAKTPTTKQSREKVKDEVGDHCRLLFKLALLHKNLDSAVDMADGHRSVRSAKYELPIYVKTNKTKYAIGSIHLVSLTEGVLDAEQKERLIANRCVNLQGGKNNNMALDEYVELLNRDSKVVCSGHQTKESILRHSKEFPHVVNFAKHFDSFSNVSTRKGFHHLPSYDEDVKKIATQLCDMDAFSYVEGRELKCKSLCTNKNIFNDCFRGFATLVHRHKPLVAFHRLRNKHI